MRIVEIFGFVLVVVSLVLGGYVLAEDKKLPEVAAEPEQPRQPADINNLVEMIANDTGSDECRVTYEAKGASNSRAIFGDINNQTQYTHIEISFVAHVVCIKKLKTQEQ